MKAIQRYTCALLLVFVCLPLLADDCPAIQAFHANSVQTGEPVTLEWSYTGGAPQTQTLTGHDFETPAILGPNARSYTYVPSKPGEKHAQLAAVTACGTVSTSTRYHVKQCNVVAQPVTIDQTSVEPGAVIHASIEAKPGHTVRWEVINGTASATTGPAIQVTAGVAGAVVINAWTSRGSSCAVLSTATVQVVQACPIQEPVVYHPQAAIASSYFSFYVDHAGPGETFTIEVHGAAQILWTDPHYVDFITPASGSFSVDVVVTNGTCTRTFTYPFTVKACTASAVVTPGQTGECGPTTAVVELTGVAPFYGYWSDGQEFFTYETRVERPIAGGTYELWAFFDAECQGQVTGNVTGGSSMPSPVFQIDEMVDGFYYGNDTCPGLVRTARLTNEIPAGASIEWSLSGGTVVSGQGTPVVQYVANEPGRTNLTAVFTDPQGCSPAPTVERFGMTLGAPLVSVRVEPSVIPAGGTALVTIDSLTPYVRGMDVTSSLGDTIVPLGPSGQWEYRSASGGGVATITVRTTNACETLITSTTLTIDGSNPLPATATVRAIGNDCSTFNAYAQLTGVPPFTGTWSNGETFVSDYPDVFLHPITGGTYTLTAFADANGPGTITGSATFDFTALPKPEFSLDVASICPNGTVTATLTTPLPEGAFANWNVWGGQIVSGQGTGTIQIQAEDGAGAIGVGVSVSGPGFCSPYADPNMVLVQFYVQQPIFDTYGVYVGGSTQFDVYLDANTESWAFENSMGDTMEIIGNPQPNVYTIRYTSTHGFGDSSIRISGTTTCGLTFENTRVMNVLPPAPTATLSWTPGETCGATITATFTGTAPFSGTWWDGVTFTTNESTISRFVGLETWAYVYSVSDVYGGNALSESIYVASQRPPFIAITGDTQTCVGGQATVTADLPPGWQIEWRAVPTAAPGEDEFVNRLSIVSGANSATVVVEGVIAGSGGLNPVIMTPEGCINYQSYYVEVVNCIQ